MMVIGTVRHTPANPLRHLCPPVVLLLIANSVLAYCPEPAAPPGGASEAAPEHSHPAHGRETGPSSHGDHPHRNDGSDHPAIPSCHCDGQSIAGVLPVSGSSRLGIVARITPAQEGIEAPVLAFFSAVPTRNRAGPDATAPPLYLTNSAFLI